MKSLRFIIVLSPIFSAKVNLFNLPGITYLLKIVTYLLFFLHLTILFLHLHCTTTGVQCKYYIQMIGLSNVTYWYEPGKDVLQDISATIMDGRIYGLFGLNGSGKTTLLKLMAGLLFPKEGKILCEGEDTVLRKADTLAEIAFMPAEFELKSSESIRKYVSLNSVFYPLFSRQVLEDCLDAFGINTPDTALGKLSLGQKHKFMLAFILSLGTKYIFLDEPLNGMDMPSRTAFRKLIARHLREDQSMVISTHVMTDVSKIVSDVLIVRNDGTLFCDSTVNLSQRYSYGISDTDSGAVYAENCAEGYRVLRMNGGFPESEIPMDILFNAVIKGAVK